MKITYENLIKKLEDKFKKVNENEFIIKKIERTGQEFKLTATKTDDLKFETNRIKKLIISDQNEAEKAVLQFGIVFSDQNIVFLRIKEDNLYGTTVEKLQRDLNKKTNAFERKYREFLKNPADMASWDNLYDRTDIVDEFYVLYIKAKENLVKNTKGFHDDVLKDEFADKLLMQILIIWYLQEKLFFNEDKSYLISQFKNYSSLGFRDFYSFLQKLIELMMISKTNSTFNEEDGFGKIVATGPAPFINGALEKGSIDIPDVVFYIEGETEYLKNYDPVNIETVPILNLFESRDWTEGNFDEFVLGAIYEKLMTLDKKKKTGAYYTPEEITDYICKSTIIPYLLNRVNDKFGKNFNSIESILEDESKEPLIFLFENLKDIKILDPAVGSAHFIEEAINLLTNIYEKIWMTVNKVGISKGFLINIADETGTLQNINFIDIKDKEQFKMYIKFFIILSKNIYGVDINPTAVNVAKARLFLNIAKHFDLKKKNIIKFPNIHFNIRVGNSLIGYVELEKENKKKHLTLDSFFKKEDINQCEEKIKPITHLQEYLITISKVLNLKGDIKKEINELNTFLAKKEKSAEDFKKILLIKAKLIKILITSLNSSYALPINDLLNQITNLFNNSLIQKFSKDYKVNLKEISKHNYFFWNFEFPEVFLNRGGFNIIIGNPPYGNILSKIEKIVLEKRNILKTMKTEEGIRGSKNTASLFVEKSYELLRDDGYLGMIIPKSMLYINEWSKLRDFLLTKVDLKRVVDNSRAFRGVKLEMCTIIYKKTNELSDRVVVHNFYLHNFKKYSTLPKEIKKEFLTVDRFITEIDEQRIEIKNTILNKSRKLGDGIAENFRGLSLNKFVKDEPNEEFIKILRGKDIERYTIRNYGYVDKDLIDDYDSSSIIIQRIVAHIGNPIPHIKIIAAYNENKMPTVNTLTNLKIIDNNFVDKYILVLLNSKLINWYIYKFIYVNAIRSMDFVGKYCDETPIKMISLECQEVFEKIANYILFLKKISSSNDLYKLLLTKILDFTDLIVYDIFLDDKINADLTNSIREFVTRIIDKGWTKNNDIKRDNLEKIENFCMIIDKNAIIIKKIEKIKECNWIKIIEGYN